MQPSIGRFDFSVVAVPMGDVDSPLRIDRDPSGMRLNRECSKELPFGRKSLYSLIEEFRGVHLIVLADRNAHACGKLSLAQWVRTSVNLRSAKSG
jgi:hypothetical protein